LGFGTRLDTTSKMKDCQTNKFKGYLICLNFKAKYSQGRDYILKIS